MAKKRCISCSGGGKVMGMGMIMQDCEACDGAGKIFVPDDELDFLAMKQTESYQKAKDKLKAVDNTIDDKKAEELLDKSMKEAQVEVETSYKKTPIKKEIK